MPNVSLRVVDVEKPNLYRETFPYTEFPKVVFDNQPVPYDIPQDIWITDTTFRDGQQARPPYTPEQMLRIYDLLHQIDGGTGLIRQCEFFLYSDKDRKAVELCQQRGYKYPEITGWIRAVAADFKLVAKDRAAGDRHPDLRQRLPHLPEARQDADPGARQLSGYRQGRPRRRRAAALPLRGHHAGRLRRLRPAVCGGADEAVGAVRPAGQDPALRHAGLRRALAGDEPCRAACPS